MNNENQQSPKITSKDTSVATENKNQQLEGILNGVSKVKFFDVSKGEVDKYFLISINKRSIFRVSKKEFTSRDLKPVLIFNKNKYRCLDGTKNENFNLLKFLNFKPEGILDSFIDFKDGLALIGKIVTELGKTERKVVSLFSGAVAKKKEILNLIMSLTSTLLNFIKIYKNGIDIYQVIELCISFYRSYCATTEVFEPQSDIPLTLVMSMASLFMPKSLFEIIKRMSMLTSAKLCDDLGGFYQIYTLFVSFLTKMIEYIPFKVPDFISSILNRLSDTTNYGLIYSCNLLYKKWLANKQLMLELTFRNEVKEMHLKIVNNHSIDDWTKRSKGASTVISDFKKLNKATMAYESSSRVEPCCFVFEGPPGCFKSVFMSNLIKSLKQSAYSHITKDIKDGKDFYDSYNNEDIFYMDDVGQMGISQYRLLINLVSPIKLPLDCATAELKDTKYFSSSKILLTTNDFSNLQGLCKSDGISNVKALWRRAYVFDFSNVKRIGSSLQGVIQFKYFDQNSGKWIFDFPPEIKKIKLPISYKIESSEPRITVLSWMKAIVEITSDIKTKNLENNTLSNEEIIEIERLSSSFKAESAFSDSYIVSFFHFCSEVIESFTENFNLNTLLDFSSNGKKFIAGCFALVVGLGLYTLTSYSSKKFCGETELDDHNVPKEDNLHPSILSLKKQLFKISLFKDGLERKSIALVTNRFIITVNHTCFKEDAYVTIYKDEDVNHILVDKLKVTEKFRDHHRDLVVWEMPTYYPTPFKDISNNFIKVTNSKKVLLVHPKGVYNMDHISSKVVEEPTPYTMICDNTTYTNYLRPSDFQYTLRSNGMCGSLVTTEDGKILGMHVAGSKQLGVGVSLRYDEDFLKTIKDVVSPHGLSIDTQISDKIIPNFSGIKIDENKQIFTPKKSNLVPSPFLNLFPSNRVPSELSKYGPHTVKDVAKKSFSPIVNVDDNEINFGKNVLRSIMCKFGDLPFDEVIKGNTLLAKINMHSSNGFNCPKNKEECVDMLNGCLIPEFKKDYDMFKHKISCGELKTDDVMWFETLKDELRTEGKDPRSFRVSRIHMQLLTKTVFGKLVEHIVSNRNQNEIMIGVNPFLEWQDIYHKINTKYKWAADIGKYDGKMLSQVQQAIAEVFKEFYTGDQKYMDAVISFTIFCAVAINDDTYITTHSMPSGSWMTAMWNSLCNRFYTAMWYYRNMKDTKPTVAKFNIHITDLVYGDDRVNALNNSEYANRLNAITMRDFFNSIGMEFTDSSKQPVTTEFQKIEDITFLKRSFEYHPTLMAIVGPLDINTINSTISFVDSKKDTTQVIQDKISAFQREIYLHKPSEWLKIKELQKVCESKSIPFKKLGGEYLYNLYKSGQYDYREDTYGLFT